MKRLIGIVVMLGIAAGAWAQAPQLPIQRFDCLTTGTVSLTKDSFVNYDMTTMLGVSANTIPALISQKTVRLRIWALNDNETTVSLTAYKFSSAAVVTGDLAQTTVANSCSELKEGDTVISYLQGRYLGFRGLNGTSKIRVERLK